MRDTVKIPVKLSFSINRLPDNILYGNITLSSKSNGNPKLNHSTSLNKQDVFEYQDTVLINQYKLETDTNTKQTERDKAN